MRSKPRHSELPREQRLLIENMLDALDRLFDHESSATDIHALLFATTQALIDSRFFDAMNRSLAEVRSIAQSNATSDEKRISTLQATDQLRFFLASIIGIN